MSEEKALSSEKNTAERPAPFAAMKNEVEFTSGMESASEQEQKKVKSILLEIESELNAYDRATGLKKIAFSRNFHIRPDLLEKSAASAISASSGASSIITLILRFISRPHISPI